MGVAYGFVLLMVAGCGGLERGGHPVVTTPNAGVYAPNAAPYDKTYPEWTAAWWQWALLPPASRNPMADPTGAYAGEGQSGPVWFLAGTLGGRAERTCTVPADKDIFFPIITSCAWFTDPADEPIAREWIRNSINHVTDLELTVDGSAIDGLRDFRFASPKFPVAADPDDPIWPIDPGSSALSDGYFIMLKPLAPGQHTIEFRGKKAIPGTFPKVEIFETELIFHLTVQ